MISNQFKSPKFDLGYIIMILKSSNQIIQYTLIVT